MLNKVDGILFLILALLLALIGSFFYTPVQEFYIASSSTGNISRQCFKTDSLWQLSSSKRGIGII